MNSAGTVFGKKRGGFLTGIWLMDRGNLYFRIRRYFKWIGQRWWILGLCILGSAGSAAFYAKNSPNIYRAHAQVAAKLAAMTKTQAPGAQSEATKVFLETQLHYMVSPQLLEKVRQKVQEMRGAAATKAVAVSPRAFKGPAYLTMEVESSDYQYAKDFSAIWAHEFVDSRNAQRKNSSGKSEDDLKNEIKTRESELASARAGLAAFQSKNKISNVLEAGASAQLRLDGLLIKEQDEKIRREQLETRKIEEIAAGAGVQTHQTVEKTKVMDHPTGVTLRVEDPFALVDSRQYSELKVKLRDRETEQQNHSLVLKGEHPYMLKLAAEIEQAHQRLKDFLGQVEERRRAQINSIKRDEASLRSVIEIARNDVLAARTIQLELQHLKETELTAKQNLNGLMTEARDLAALPVEGGFFAIDGEGLGSPTPISPNRPRIIWSGFALGSFFGLALIYFLGRLDDRLELAEDIEMELDERILGQIPLARLKNPRKKQLLVSAPGEQEMFAESIRGIRSSILFSEGAKKVLIVSSSSPGDGKTTIAANLAMSLALGGQRVLLVDADLRRGNIHEYFDFPRELGLSEILNGVMDWGAALRATETEKLKVITAGKLPACPGELIVSPNMKAFVEEARREFEYIIFDCPPLTSMDDVFGLAPLADGLLYVIMSGQTSMRFAKAGLNSLRQRGGKLLGLVLNGILPDNPYYYYKQYYQSYYMTETPKSYGDLPASVPIVTATKQRRRGIISLPKAHPLTPSGRNVAEEHVKSERMEVQPEDLLR
jgi:capsular exopolysaccharide synthesis family protein